MAKAFSADLSCFLVDFYISLSHMIPVNVLQVESAGKFTNPFNTKVKLYILVSMPVCEVYTAEGLANSD